MKLFIQLIFFGIALLLTFYAIFIWYAYADASTAEGFFKYAFTEEEWMKLFLIAVLQFIIAIIIYFGLWKTNFFTRNKN